MNRSMPGGWFADCIKYLAGYLWPGESQQGDDLNVSFVSRYLLTQVMHDCTLSKKLSGLNDQRNP